MTTAAENELLTRVGAGTPMGALMREYWLPALASSELQADREPLRVMLLGERLIAWRDSAGRVAVMDHRCPHRGASLFFGRNEAAGIRCVYHGWKFDVAGQCVETPNVPPNRDLRDRVRAKCYAAIERNGVVWVYMGDQSRVPPLPRIEATLAPDGTVNIQFLQRECNWLQAMEGELDSSHLGFLHYGATSAMDYDPSQAQRLTSSQRAPEYVTRVLPHGFMYGAKRDGDAGNPYWRVTQFIYPFWTLPPLNPIETNVVARAHVPMDDAHTMLVFFELERAKTPGRDARLAASTPGASMALHYLPRDPGWFGRWRLRQNRANDYLIDREIQRTRSFTGIEGVTIQDGAIQESMGEIVDRSLEHLAASDVAIALARRLLARAAADCAEHGVRPPGAADPEITAGARAGGFFAAPDEDWVQAHAAGVARATVNVA